MATTIGGNLSPRTTTLPPANGVPDVTTTTTTTTPAPGGDLGKTDAFVQGTAPTAIMPALTSARSGISEKGQAVLGEMTRQLEAKTQMTARDLFNPNVQRVEDMPLTKKLSADDMKNIAVDTAKKMPLGDLPGGNLVANAIRSTVPGADTIDGDLSTMSFNDLSKKLPKAALDEKFKPMLDDFRKNSPVAFWGLATAGAVGGGVLAYSQGSQILEKVGVKPELKQKFFDNQLAVGVSGSWGPKFSDAQGKLTLDAQTKDNRFGLGASVEGGVHGMKSATVTARANLTDYHPLGLDTLSAHASYTHDFVQSQDLASFGIAGSKGSTSFSVNGAYNLTTGNSRTEADLGTKLWGGTLSGYAAHIRENGRSDNQVGVVYRLSF